MFEAHQAANRVLEEICGLHLDLVDHRLRIVQGSSLLLSDFNFPSRAHENILHARITQLIESRDDPLPSAPQSANPVASAMVNHLLEFVGNLGSDIEVLFNETHTLLTVLFPMSIWSLCRSKLTGRCNIDDQTTNAILDKWTLDSNTSWDARIKSARELLVDADGVCQTIAKTHDGPGEPPDTGIRNVMETPVAIEEVSLPVMIGDGVDVDGDPAGNVTGFGSGAKSTRRRKKKERGYLIGSQAL